MLDEIMNVGSLRSVDDFFQGNFASTIVTIRDVLTNRHIEQDWFLRYNANW